MKNIPTCLIFYHYLTDGLNSFLILVPRHHPYLTFICFKAFISHWNKDTLTENTDIKYNFTVKQNLYCLKLETFKT